jgi:MFS family permease
MHNKTKIKRLLVVFMLLSLGSPQLGWSTAYQPSPGQTAARVLQDVTDKLEQGFATARKGQYGVFVEKNIATIGGVYAVIALLLLGSRDYRNAGWNNFGLWCFVSLILIVWFVIALWIGTAGSEMRMTHGETLFTGLIHPLVMIAFGLSVWIGVPLYLLFLLFALPSIAFVILRLLVRLPLLTYHYLHYVTVPHPAETAYRVGVANDLPIPELARTVADAMYRYDLKDFDSLPPEWKLKNYKKRIEAFDNLLKAQGGFLKERSATWQAEEERFMEEFIKNLRLKSQLRE